tara:strand:+ start:261 stop:776 length:516 start_codon:yes stop_codon:yes gene_type:complete
MNNTICWKLSKEDIIKGLSDMITYEITLEREKEYYGKLCYSNFYWYGCKVMDIIYTEFCEVIRESDFLDELLSDSLGNFNVFVLLHELTETNHDLTFSDFYEQYVSLCYQVDALSIIEIVELRDLWLKRLKQYEKVKEANAQAVIVRALYNPKTLIGNIHANYLYDENFIS